MLHLWIMEWNKDVKRTSGGTFAVGSIGAHRSHGMSNTRFCKIFRGMNYRCNGKNNPKYPIYGGRGIKVLWKSFDDFKENMYESYLTHTEKYGEKDTQIDRIDVNGNYCKENCRWVIPKIQQRNRRTNTLVSFNEQILSIAGWAEKVGLPARVISRRLIRGWKIERALKEPIGPQAKRYV